VKYNGFSSAIKYYIDRNNLSLEMAASILNINDSTISSWINGVYEPSIKRQDNYFRILDERLGKPESFLTGLE
jgi:transcriptional regulator with XRE-family HTH domain